jgi:hypothetical protein
MQAGERRALDQAQQIERGIVSGPGFQSAAIISRTFVRVNLTLPQVSCK